MCTQLGIRWIRPALIVVVLAMPTAGTAIELDNDLFTASQYGFTVSVPADWQIYRRTGFPNLLAVLAHKKMPAQVSISAETTNKALKALVAANVKGLKAVGVKITSQKPYQGGGITGTSVVSQRKVGPSVIVIQQLYFVHKQKSQQTLIVLTCSGPAKVLKAIAADWRYILETLEFTDDK